MGVRSSIVAAFVCGGVVGALVVAGWRHLESTADRPIFSEKVDRGPLWGVLQPWHLQLTVPTADGHALLADDELNIAVVIQGRAGRPWSYMSALSHQATLEVPYERGTQKLVIADQPNRIVLVKQDGTHATYHLGAGQAERLYEHAMQQLADPAEDKNLPDIMTESAIASDVLSEVHEW